MAENSNIEWTDHTVNLWWGCHKVHTGCKNCYAEHLSENRYGNGIWGNNAKRKRIKSAFETLSKINKLGSDLGKRQKVFMMSMGDIFEDSKELENPWCLEETNVTTTGGLRNILFDKISFGFYPNIIFQFLTKRPENIFKYSKLLIQDHGKYPENVWFGTSISDQSTAEDYLYRLYQVPHENKFVSIEPQVGPIKITNSTGIKWVIQGGESGSNRRPFRLDWACDMRDFCKNEGIPYFFKQINKVDPIPSDLMVREFPEEMF